jgi:hypothetical protein
VVAGGGGHEHRARRHVTATHWCGGCCCCTVSRHVLHHCRCRCCAPRATCVCVCVCVCVSLPDVHVATVAVWVSVTVCVCVSVTLEASLLESVTGCCCSGNAFHAKEYIRVVIKEDTPCQLPSLVINSATDGTHCPLLHVYCTATPTSTRASVAAASAPFHRAPHCHSVRNVVVLQHGGVDECAREGATAPATPPCTAAARRRRPLAVTALLLHQHNSASYPSDHDVVALPHTHTARDCPCCILL